MPSMNPAWTIGSILTRWPRPRRPLVLPVVACPNPRLPSSMPAHRRPHGLPSIYRRTTLHHGHLMSVLIRVPRRRLV